MSTQFYTHQAKRFWQTYPDTPRWMQDVRLQALSKLEAVGLPTTKNESYKYTNFEKLLGENYQVKTSSGQVSHNILSELDAFQLVFINGHLVFHDLPTQAISISELQNTNGELVKDLLNSTSNLLKDDPLYQLNTALLHNGIVISFKENLTRPVHLINFLDEEFKNVCHSQHNIFVCL